MVTPCFSPCHNWKTNGLFFGSFALRSLSIGAGTHQRFTVEFLEVVKVGVPFPKNE